MTHKQFLYWYLGAVQTLSDEDIRHGLSTIYEFDKNTPEADCIDACYMINGYYETKQDPDEFDKIVLKHLELVFNNVTKSPTTIKPPIYEPPNQYLDEIHKELRQTKIIC